MTDTVAERIRLLDGWLVGTGITLLEWRTPEETIRLVRAGDAVSAAATPPPPPPQEMVVTSPGVGVFRHRHGLAAADLVQPGSAVRPGDVVGLVQAGALLLHVTATVAGTVVAMAPAGTTVGYGAPLLHLAPGGAP